MDGWDILPGPVRCSAESCRASHSRYEYALMYSHSDADHLLLEGKLQADLLSVHLRRVDPSAFLLASRGFHWINELRFNR
jgi:hypothetical protein